MERKHIEERVWCENRVEGTSTTCTILLHYRSQDDVCLYLTMHVLEGQPHHLALTLFIILFIISF